MAKVYEALARAIVARLNCIASSNAEWQERWEDKAHCIVRDYLPSGSGVDSGTKLDLDACKPERIVLQTSFHHMAGNGFYDGWTDHTVTVTPSFVGGFDVKVSGRNRNDIKDYLGELYHDCLSVDMDAPRVTMSEQDLAA